MRASARGPSRARAQPCRRPARARPGPAAAARPARSSAADRATASARQRAAARPRRRRLPPARRPLQPPGPARGPARQPRRHLLTTPPPPRAQVATAGGLYTAWADKHPAYDLLNGPSGKGIADLYTPEINSQYPPGASTDYTSNPNYTMVYDKVCGCAWCVCVCV